MALSRLTGFIKMGAVALALLVPTVAAISEADARAGGRSSSGSRGMRTWSTPAPTATSPGTARPMERSMTQNTGSPAAGTVGQRPGGFFNRPGLLGGLAAGFLGAGLLGMLFGGGLFGGLGGGFASIIGLVLQIALIVIVARLALNWWRRRNQPALASGPDRFDAPQQQQATQQQGGFLGGLGLGGGGSSAQAAPVEITPADYDAFERLLSDIQSAWSNEDMQTLARMTTPEMESYFRGDLRSNQEKGVVNQVSDVKLLQGDLSEAWREDNREYATVALRFQLVDKTIEKATGRLVDGSERLGEATEVWTFVRTNGGPWELSAIQQI